jgi:putative ABC transport system permease protein
MRDLLQDLGYAARTLRLNRSFTAVAALTLALGVGANTATFSVVHKLLIDPLPYPRSERLGLVWRLNPTMGGLMVSPSAENAEQWRAARSIERLTAFSGEEKVLTGDGEPQEARVGLLAPDLLDFLGVVPVLGRKFTLADASSESAARVALIGEALWARRFGRDPAAVGRTLELDDERYRIVGVLPAWFRLPLDQHEIWVPWTKSGEPASTDRVSVLVRLKPGVALADAARELGALAGDTYVGSSGWAVQIVAPGETTARAVRRALLVLSGAVGFVLLIGCANVANLSIARNSGRARELAMRAALGASRGRLVRQLVTESLLVSAIGGAAGLLMASWGIYAVRALRPAEITELGSVTLSLPVLAFSIALTMASGLLVGVWPAWRAAAFKGLDVLRTGRLTVTRGTERLRRTLTIAEVALSLVLLVGAGLLARSFARLQAADLGFRPESLLATTLTLPESRYGSPLVRATLQEDLASGTRALPGVRAVALALGIPPRGGISFGRIQIERPTLAPAEAPTRFSGGPVSAEYFAVLGIPFRDGRSFTNAEIREGAPVVIVNETMARRYWPGQAAVGKRIRLGSAWWTIVGVAADVRQHGALTSPTDLQVYTPFSRASAPAHMVLLVRAEGDPAALVPALKGLVWRLDPKLPLEEVATVEHLIAESIARPRFNLALLAVFATLGLLLAAIGIYGVLSASVVQRLPEIGVRVILGATRARIFRHVVGEGLLLAGVGIVLGLGGSMALTRVLSSLLFEVSVTDPIAFAVVPALLLVVAGVACYMPARRASLIDPAETLRAS